MTRSHATSFNIGLVWIGMNKDNGHDNVDEGDEDVVGDHEGDNYVDNDEN